MKGRLLLVLVLMVGMVKGQNIAQDSLTINNIAAGFFANGSLFQNTISGFRVPKSGNAQSIYSGAIWIGGIDGGGQLHLAAGTYRQSGDDFWPGPAYINALPIDSINSNNWNKIWHITKNEIDVFRANTFPVSMANVPASILQWPGKGNANAVGNNGVSLAVGQDAAPFVDVDFDGLYNPLVGDYPDINGDEMLWWVYNDMRVHGETGGLPLGVEIRASAYAFLCPSDTIINNTIFIKQKVINKGNLNLHDVYIGSWTDFQFGCSNYYIGSDSTQSTYYGYPHDISNCSNSYDSTMSPIQLVTTLNSPLDTQGFPSGIRNFIAYANNFSSQGNPQNPQHYYSYLKARWGDNTPITRDSCSGHGGVDSSGPKFMFPSDPNVSAINFPFSWSQCSCNSIGGGLRGVGGAGPFNLTRNDEQIFEQAYIFDSRRGVHSCPSNPASAAWHIKDFYNGTTTGPCRYNTGIIETAHASFQLNLFPNPATNSIHYTVYGLMDKATYSVMDITGRQLQVGEMAGNGLNTGTIDIANYPTGIYVFRLSSAAGTIVRRIVVEKGAN